ncbi:Uncharacterized protein FWK35_00030260, partial [Aphis craccivora]
YSWPENSEYIYKPPINKWETESLRLYEHPTLYVGDYNSRHHEWGYEANDENAGFHKGRSCCEQVLTLTSSSEAGYQKCMKTGVILMDLSSVHDTVRRERLLLKLSRVVWCKKTIDLIKSMLTNRRMILTGTRWGAGAEMLRIAALSLMYSASEYYALEWTKSKHAKKINTQLNTTMRIISGTHKSTSTPWLPIISNIPPPPLRREEFLIN